MDFNFLGEEDVGWRHRLGRIVLTLTFCADALFRRIAAKFWRVNISRRSLSRLVPDARASLATPLEAATLPDNAFDLALCIALFHLVPPRQIEDYLGLVQRTTKPGGLFISLQPRKEDNNPLLYPYRLNELVLWEPDEFHESALQWAPRDAYLLRIERITK